MTVTVRHVRGPSAFHDVGAEFDHLTAATGAPLTARRRWLQCWIDTHPTWQPWLVLLEDHQRLLGCAPLATRRHGPLTHITMLGHGPTDDARLPALPGTAPELAHAVTAALPCGPWRLRLAQLPTHDPVVAELHRLLATAALTPGQGLPQVQVTTTDPNDYLSKNTRKALAKIGNRLSTQHVTAELTWTSTPTHITNLLPALMRVHRDRDLALGRRPDHRHRTAAAFFSHVITTHAQSGDVQLLTLRLNNELAAYVCAFTDTSALRVWDNRMAPEWAHLSPGRLANTEALRHVVRSNHYDTLDWMRGEEPYKLQSATRVVPTTDLHAWSSPLLQHAEQIASAGARTARAALHASPALLRTRTALRTARR